VKSVVSIRTCTIALAVCVLGAVALLASRPAKGAQDQGTKSDESTLVVDGSHWTTSSAQGRRAFLIGIANMIMAEAAYAKGHDLKPPPVGDRITKAVADLQLDGIELRITRWYEDHPQEKSMPVMGVIWKDLVREDEPKQ